MVDHHSLSWIEAMAVKGTVKKWYKKGIGNKIAQFTCSIIDDAFKDADADDMHEYMMMLAVDLFTYHRKRRDEIAGRKLSRDLKKAEDEAKRSGRPKKPGS